MKNKEEDCQPQTVAGLCNRVWRWNRRPCQKKVLSVGPNLLNGIHAIEKTLVQGQARDEQGRRADIMAKTTTGQEGLLKGDELVSNLPEWKDLFGKGS